MPGLGANSKIFEYILLPRDTFEIHFLEWKIPYSFSESLQEYALRISEDITHKKPILLGVSFGGILVQEIAKVLEIERIIIVSSIKSHQELPYRLKLFKITKVYKFFPSKIIENIEDYTKYFMGDFLKKRAKIYERYLSVRDMKYMKWAIYNLLHWQQENPPKNLLHIHGNDDHIFPSKHINNYTLIDNGTHIMILLKAKEISEIIIDNIT
tara:strand:+ start:795 stop:1427 length:633 start_codon:yes stop_codon:yes gene_type:complete